MIARTIGVYLTLKLFIIIIVCAGVGAGLYAYGLYKDVYEPSIFIKKNKETQHFYIPTGSTFEEVDSLIRDQFMVRYPDGLSMVMERKKYPEKVKPGKYLITTGMSNNAFVNLLRSGNQEEIKYVLKFHRVMKKAAYKISTLIEASYGDMMVAVNDEVLLDSLGFTKENLLCLFIPNTYNLHWNTSAEEFLFRMHREYKTFWNESRLARAKALDLTPEEVITLASIVDRETKWNDEKQRVAGVYLNRLRKGIRLQADPTVVYSVGDFEIRRVLKRHIKTKSPYNTYLNAGLPPGPICTPSITSIEAVLYAEEHKYIYFCANADFSGYHSFAVTLKEHNANAKRFQRALNKRKIYK